MNNRVALVTGHSGNLGPIWCKTLMEMGYRVIGLGLPYHNIADKKSVHAFIGDNKLDREENKPSVIVCNAAIDIPPQGESDFFEDYENIINVNLIGHLHLLKELLPDNVEKDCVVINIGSIMGHSGCDWRRYVDVGLNNFTKPVAYNLSKRALIQLSQSITTEYGEQGIRSVTISLGPVDTEKFNPEFKKRILQDIPLRKLVSKEDLQSALRFAIECKSFAGNDVLIDNGLLSW